MVMKQTTAWYVDWW